MPHSSKSNNAILEEKNEPELNNSSVYGDTSSANHQTKPMLEGGTAAYGAGNVSICHESDTTLLMNTTENGSPAKRPSQTNSAVKVYESGACKQKSADKIAVKEQLFDSSKIVVATESKR